MNVRSRRRQRAPSPEQRLHASKSLFAGRTGFCHGLYRGAVQLERAKAKAGIQP